jgi:RNA polymerase sigma factor (sigma-70 family)
LAETEGHITLHESAFDRLTGRVERPDTRTGPGATAHAVELALIARCLDGEAAACSELYHRYYRQVMPICMRYARRTEEAKDILQDSFTRAFTKLHSYTGKGPFIGWLKRVTLNTAINHYHASTDERSTVRIDDLAPHSPVTADPNGDQVLARLGAEELLALVRALPRAYRMVFNLRVVEGWSHEDIARELGISIGASKSNLSRARVKLMEQVIGRETAGTTIRTEHEQR